LKKAAFGCRGSKDGSRCKPAKVLIPFHAQPEARNQMWVELQGLEKTFGIRSVLNWTVTTARRERL